MKITSILLALGYASLIAKALAYHSFRAVPAQRRLALKDWPYAFLVSHVGKLDGQDWCFTAKNGVSDNSNVGFDLCDFQGAPDMQLFLLDENGKMHSKLNPNQCLVVDQGTSISGGHSRIKFCSCDESVVYNTFLHDRETDVIRVGMAPSYCLKQTGNGPDRTDSIRTETCDEKNPCFIYDYVEHECSTSLADVDCCDTTDCGRSEICKDYACECSTTREGVDCCTDEDCSGGLICSNHDCVTPDIDSRCNLGNFGIDCCSNADCPTGYDCEANTCIKPAVFLVSTIDNQDWCISANRGIGEFEDVGSELCDFSNAPPRQLWHFDTNHMIRSDIDLNRCMIVGPGTDIFMGLHIHMASCKLAMFAYDDVTDHLHLGEDPAYCVTSSQAEVGGRICGKPCVEGDNFEFTMRPV